MRRLPAAEVHGQFVVSYYSYAWDNIHCLASSGPQCVMLRFMPSVIIRKELSVVLSARVNALRGKTVP